MRRVPVGATWWRTYTRKLVFQVLWNAEFEYHSHFYTRVHIKAAYHFELKISWKIGICCHCCFTCVLFMSWLIYLLGYETLYLTSS
jgi:hypothetical protein